MLIMNTNENCLDHDVAKLIRFVNKMERKHIAKRVRRGKLIAEQQRRKDGQMPKK